VGELVGTSTTKGIGGIIASLGGFAEAPTTSSTQSTSTQSTSTQSTSTQSTNNQSTSTQSKSTQSTITQTKGFNGLVFTGNGSRTRRGGSTLVRTLFLGAVIGLICLF
jgi:hypothetical protein